MSKAVKDKTHTSSLPNDMEVPVTIAQEPAVLRESKSHDCMLRGKGPAATVRSTSTAFMARSLWWRAPPSNARAR